MTDGGYYALKGFAFQFDKSILEILNNPDKEIAIEQEQDINYEDYLVQIKYYETAYDEPQIKQKLKDTTVSLLQQYSADESKSYCLYAYFRGQDEKKWYLTIDDLNDLLGNKKSDFDENLKNRFVKKYVIVFANDFKRQFNSTISAIKSSFHECSDDELACLYHSIIFQYLLNLVISNKVKGYRKCKKSCLNEVIKRSRDIVFSNAYKEYLGKDKYCRFIKKIYFSYLNVSPYDRIFIFETIDCNKIHELKELVLEIIRKWSKNTNRTTSPYAPYICLVGCDKSLLATLKRDLLDEGFVFKDGYDFYNADFNVKTLTVPVNQENKICLKFINDEANLLDVIHNISNTKELYQFYIDKYIHLDVPFKNVKIQIDEIKDIIYMI